MSVSPFVRPSDRIKQLGSNWADFHKIWYSSISWKICREKSSVVKIWQERQEIYAKNYRGADKSLAQPGKEKSSDTCQGRARFQQHRDASCHQVFSPPARQGAEGNSYHSDRNINLLPFWSGWGLISNPVRTFIIVSSRMLLGMKNFPRKSCRENLNTNFVFNNFSPEIHAFTR